MPKIDKPDFTCCRENAIRDMKRKLIVLKDKARKIEKFIEFLEHWEEINGKLDNDIEELLWEISRKLD